MDKQKYTICSRCIMDNENVPDIFFDEKGICNYCHTYEKIDTERRSEKTKIKMEDLLKEIKSRGKKKLYDCILGISGGVDSCYAAYLTKKYGLRPLAVHLDNGWNTAISVKNIENTVKKLNFDLYIYVIDWDEFRDLQLSFLKASVIDIEMLTDHAIMAILYKTAAKQKVKYIISGINFQTEGILPKTWAFYKTDLMNIKNIHKRFGKLKVKTFPHLSFFRRMYYTKIKKIKFIPLLEYIDYNKADAKKVLSEELNWEDYENKHYESVFTRFYQSYILPKKFNVDKRKYHLSTLIYSKQITRDEALRLINKPIIDEKLLQSDKELVLKKLTLTEKEFEELMNLPIKKHTDYRSIINIYNKLKPIKKFFVNLYWLNAK